MSRNLLTICTRSANIFVTGKVNILRSSRTASIIGIGNNIRVFSLTSGSFIFASQKKDCKENNCDTKMSLEKKEELLKKLSPLQYHVTQEAGTERPYSGKYNKHYESGTYVCVVCNQELFSSDTKYDSGCGWPAFNDVLEKGKVTLHADPSLAGNLLLLITKPGMMRTEVRCSKCGAHMGHVFDDGPKPTRKRYCINSASIEFIPAAKS